MKTTGKIVRIGNSKGLRLPKQMLEELELSELVQMETRGSELIIRSAQDLHEGWEESAKAMRTRNDDALLLGDIPVSEWDSSEWNW